LIVAIIADTRRVKETSADAGLELYESCRIADTCGERIAVLEAVFLTLDAESQDFTFDETEIALIIEFYALALIKAWYDRNDVPL
jgi:hypothetical protein